jgi:hypothetical protein
MTIAIEPLRNDAPEKEYAIELANHALDNLDPDEDMAVLARQLLRALERLGEYEPPKNGH